MCSWHQAPGGTRNEAQTSHESRWDPGLPCRIFHSFVVASLLPPPALQSSLGHSFYPSQIMGCSQSAPVVETSRSLPPVAKPPVVEEATRTEEAPSKEEPVANNPGIEDTTPFDEAEDSDMVPFDEIGEPDDDSVQEEPVIIEEVAEEAPPVVLQSKVEAPADELQSTLLKEDPTLIEASIPPESNLDAAGIPEVTQEVPEVSLEPAKVEVPREEAVAPEAKSPGVPESPEHVEESVIADAPIDEAEMMAVVDEPGPLEAVVQTAAEPVVAPKAPENDDEPVAPLETATIPEDVVDPVVEGVVGQSVESAAVEEVAPEDVVQPVETGEILQEEVEVPLNATSETKTDNSPTMKRVESEAAFPEALLNENEANGRQEDDAISKPKPNVFAIMRFGHDVIRGSMQDVAAALDAQNFAQAKETWNKCRSWMYLHMLMEEGTGSGESPLGMFRVLDKEFDGVATEAGLRDSHESLEKLESAVESLFTAEDADLESTSLVFKEFQEANLLHLKVEEDIMMPKVQEMGKNGVPMKKVVKEELLATIVHRDDYKFFVQYAIGVLDHSARDTHVAARAFALALWALATSEQWNEWDAWIKEVGSVETYNELQRAIVG